MLFSKTTIEIYILLVNMSLSCVQSLANERLLCLWFALILQFKASIASVSERSIDYKETLLQVQFIMELV